MTTEQVAATILNAGISCRFPTLVLDTAEGLDRALKIMDALRVDVGEPFEFDTATGEPRESYQVRTDEGDDYLTLIGPAGTPSDKLADERWTVTEQGKKALDRIAGDVLECTGAVMDDGQVQHDGATCPIHERVGLAENGGWLA